MAETKVALTVVDWIAAILVGLILLSFVLFAVVNTPVYESLFAEFGSELPTLTKVVLRPWFPLAWALVPGALVFVAIAPWFGWRRIWRRLSLGAAGFVALLGWAVWLLAMYLPIFSMASNIQ